MTLLVGALAFGQSGDLQLSAPLRKKICLIRDQTDAWHSEDIVKATASRYASCGVEVSIIDWATIGDWLQHQGLHSRMLPELKLVSYCNGVGAQAAAVIAECNNAPTIAATTTCCQVSLFQFQECLVTRRQINFHTDDLKGLDIELLIHESLPELRADRPSPFSICDCLPRRTIQILRASSIDDDATQFLGIRLEVQEQTQGLLVSDIIRNSPAERADIRPGDRIISVDGSAVESMNDLVHIISRCIVSQGINIRVHRGDIDIVKKVSIASHKSVWVNRAMEYLHSPEETEMILTADNASFDRSELLRQKDVIIYFWATWCGPCKENLAELQILANRFKNEFVWIGVSADTDESKWKNFISTNRLAGVHVRSAEWIKAFDVTEFPSVFLVSDHGRSIERVFPFRLGSHLIRRNNR